MIPALELDQETSVPEPISAPPTSRVHETLDLVLVGAMFVVLFLLGGFVGLATSWPAVQRSLSLEAVFIGRSAAVTLGILVSALLYLRFYGLKGSAKAGLRSQQAVQKILIEVRDRTLQILASADERSLRVAAQKALLMNLKFTDRLEGMRRMLMEALDELEEENRKLKASLRGALRHLDEQTRRLEAAVQESTEDPLTKVANRRSFDTRLQRACEARKSGKKFALALVDIDFFKKVNDTHGHPAGDTVLRGVAGLLRKTLRAQDFVARYGGEEFALILDEAGEMAARLAMERTRCQLGETTWKADGVAIQITASFGVAEADANETAAELLARADRALYAAKEQGRNRVVTVTDVDKEKAS